MAPGRRALLCQASNLWDGQPANSRDACRGIGERSQQQSCNSLESAANVLCQLPPPEGFHSAGGRKTRSCGAGGAAGMKPPGTVFYSVFHCVFLCPLRLAQSRTNPQVLDTGLTAQDIQSAETLSPVDWNKMDPGTAEKDDLFMF